MTIAAVMSGVYVDLLSTQIAVYVYARKQLTSVYLM